MFSMVKFGPSLAHTAPDLVDVGLCVVLCVGETHGCEALAAKVMRLRYRGEWLRRWRQQSAPWGLCGA